MLKLKNCLLVFVAMALGGAISVDRTTLPEPYQNPSVSNPTRTVEPPQGWMPKLAKGYEDSYQVSVFADGLDRPRNLLVDGKTVYVAEQFNNRILTLTNGEKTTCLEGFDEPFGMAIHKGKFFVADTRAVWQVECGKSKKAITSRGALGRGWGHTTRNLVFGENGDFFVAIGSMGNIGEEATPHATVQKFSGKTQTTFASGVRNPVGIAIHPTTKRVWATVIERDGMGDDLVPDYLTDLTEGGFYGWPYYYLGYPQPDFPTTDQTPLIPKLLFKAHSSPMAVTFWNGDAFVALRGSWNSSRPRGFMVAQVMFGASGEPVANEYQPFLVDFVSEGKDGTPLAKGRPVSVAPLNGDTLLVADETGGVIWQVSKN